jgi:transcriptional antiterminator NusG
MSYYTIQVQPTTEENYIKRFHTLHPGFRCKLHFPQREMRERRKGEFFQKQHPIFPGYIFLETPEEDFFSNIFSSRKKLFHKTDEFNQFIKTNINIKPLKGSDLKIAVHFIKKFCPVAGASQVYFNEKDRLVAISGALKGLEEKIIKVDKRKGRAKIKIDFYSATFTIDLPFDVVG